MKFCVIGLGRFGYQMAVSLAQNGMEVLVVDETESIVESIRDKVTQAICYHIDNEESLKAIGIDEMDTVIVAMGESFAESIVITALLKKNLQIPYVIARATNSIHEQILKLTGADRVIMPERDSGVRFANSLSLRFSDFVPITDNFAVTQIPAPQSWVGKTIGELNLRKGHLVSCIAVKKEDQISLVTLEYLVHENDTLVITGSNQDLGKLKEL